MTDSPAPGTDPRTDPSTGTRTGSDLDALTGERADLLEVLRKHRALFRVTVQGLSDDQARTRSTVSELTLGRAREARRRHRGAVGQVHRGGAARGRRRLGRRRLEQPTR